MITNVLAMILSFAMMLTGVTAPIEAPVAKSITISDVTFRYNDESVALDPTATLGVMTDGTRADLAFHVESNGERLLPVGITVTEDALMIGLDGGEKTIRLSAEELEALLPEDAVTMTGDADIIFGEYLPMMMSLKDVVTDEAQVKAINDAINANIERGDASPGKVEFDGVEYDVETYSYSLDGAELGRAIDAGFASNEAMNAFAQSYFEIFKMAAEEDEAMPVIDSFESVYGMIDMRMDLTESVSEKDGLTVNDGVIRFMIPDVEDPFTVDIHSVELPGRSEATVQSIIEVEGVSGEISMAIDTEGDAGTMSMNISIGTTATADGETDAADDLDFSASLAYDTTEGACAIDLNIGFDTPVGGGEFSINGAEGSYRTVIGLWEPEDNLEFGFTVTATDAPFAAPTDEANAIALDAIDESLIEGVMTDAMKLAAEPSVTAFGELFDRLFTVTEVEDEVVEDKVEVDYEPADAEAPSIGMPILNYIPEGFEIADTNVDLENNYVSFFLACTDPDVYDYVSIDVSASYKESGSFYVINEDGTTEPIDRPVFTADKFDTFTGTSMDDGRVNIGIYYNNDVITIEEVGKIYAGIDFAQ